MYRYSSDSDEAYYASRQQSDNIRSSGWQSPIPRMEETKSSPVTRLVVDSPFGSKKCDYTIDRSQAGRLIVTARRRQTFASDYLSLNNKNNNTAIQTFTIPVDADVNRLQSRVEQHTNRLIIEIPRTPSGLTETRNTYVRSPNLNGSPFRRNHLKEFDRTRKFEHRIDCQGYKADDLDVFIEGQDLIVQGKTKRSTSSDPHYHQQSKEFSRKVSLPHNVDLARVVSYFENGELRIEAPYKRVLHYDQGEILSPEGMSTTVTSRMATGGYNRVQSPIGGNHRRHYRRRERVNRQQQPTSTMAIQRVRSADALHYPLSKSIHEWDDDGDEEDHFYRRAVKYKRYNNAEQPSAYRSFYEPSNNGVVSRTTTYRTYPTDQQVYFKY